MIKTTYQMKSGIKRKKTTPFRNQLGVAANTSVMPLTRIKAAMIRPMTPKPISRGVMNEMKPWGSLHCSGLQLAG